MRRCRREPGPRLHLPRPRRAWAGDRATHRARDRPRHGCRVVRRGREPVGARAARPGERVLDLGSGAGFDSLVAAQMVGRAPAGPTGIDYDTRVLTKARIAAAAEMNAPNVEFVESEAEPAAVSRRELRRRGLEQRRRPHPDKTPSSARGTGSSSFPAGGFRSRTSRSESVSARRSPRHRPVDRLNCQRSAGSSVREAPGTAWLRADRDRAARRHPHAPGSRDTRRKAQKFGARGTTTKACSPKGEGRGAQLRSSTRKEPTSPPCAGGRLPGPPGARDGLGDGRPTPGSHVTQRAFSPSIPIATRSRAPPRSLPAELAQRVVFRLASAKEIELERHSFDIVVFSWSLDALDPEGRRGRPGSDGRRGPGGEVVLDLR